MQHSTNMHFAVIITSAKTTTNGNRHLAPVVLAIPGNLSEVSPNANIHGSFKTTKQMISLLFKPLRNDLKTTVKCMFSCNVFVEP